MKEITASRAALLGPDKGWRGRQHLMDEESHGRTAGEDDQQRWRTEQHLETPPAGVGATWRSCGVDQLQRCIPAAARTSSSADQQHGVAPTLTRLRRRLA
ncbi:hypothetical protein Syun_027918 [Stephania yunnanensis]|uniref:Uncharacterized protein n=1 Tax=Stephania yunnanensis TaxID=152371 RepID=A0AAP0EJS4_9MAGN